MNWYGYSLRRGVLVAANVELIAAGINFIIATIWTEDLNDYDYKYWNAYIRLFYHIYLAGAIISGWIVLCVVYLIIGASQNSQKIMLISIILSIINTIANIAVLSVFTANIYSYEYVSGGIAYIIIYFVFKLYFIPMMRIYYNVLTTGTTNNPITGPVMVSTYPAYGQSPAVVIQHGYPNMQQPYPNVQYPQVSQQYPNVPPPYTHNQPYTYDQQQYSNDRQPYPNDQQQYPYTRQPYPDAQQPYPNDQQPYPNAQQSHSSVQQPYSNDQQPYPNAQQSHSSVQQPYPNDPRSFSNAQRYPSKY